MAHPTIAASYANALLDFAVAKGANRTALLTRAQLGGDAIQRADDRIRLDLYVALLRAAAELCGEPGFALQFGERVRFEDVSIVGLIAAAARTIGEGRLQLNRYARLVVDQDDAGASTMLDLVRDGDGLWLQLNGRLYAEEPQLTEAAFARTICGARANLGSTEYFRTHRFPRAIHFKYPEPSYRAEYDRVFGVPLVFGSDRNAMSIDEEFLAVELPPANRYVFGVLTERAGSLLKELEDARSTRGRVEAALLPILHTGAASMASVAHKLTLSRQTLYRRLREEGVTFEKVLDELRHRMALSYLEGKKVSVNETAYLVGFSDPATFSRAFKRWTGAAPSRKLAPRSARRPRSP
jgi:AraC-like DNA-binding protein